MTLDLIQLKPALKKLAKKYGLSLVYLFGSHALGNATRRSDVDIAVLFTPELTKFQRFESRLELMGLFSKVFKRDVDVVVLNDIKSLLFKYAIFKEGELLYEKSEEARIEFERSLLGLYFDFQPFLEKYNRHYVKTHLQ